jgi:hypothetical protein
MCYEHQKADRLQHQMSSTKSNPNLASKFRHANMQGYHCKIDLGKSLMTENWIDLEGTVFQDSYVQKKVNVGVRA